jgi:peptidoglycan/xylan/chitin deacetylase (PgdA/CDA1 family)
VKSLLKTAKASLFQTKGLGLFPVVASTGWRSRRLLILCYHGIAMGQEYDSHPAIFQPADIFERRMSILKDFGANVLDLGEALRRLKSGDLPPRSVAITFDDGWADFYTQAYPALRKFGFPATVYLTTYYCFYNRPIFLFALRHMIWKQRERCFDGHRFSFLPPVLDLQTEENRSRVLDSILEHARANDLSGRQKDDLAAEFAQAIGFDYSELTRDRLFHLMNPEEVGEISAGGIDVQLHTHRHRTPVDRGLFVQEIQQNRQYITELTGRNHVVHFCYPSGANQPDFLRWLREAGVESATTCDQDYTSQQSNPLLLPRLLDQFAISDHEFEAWLTGFMGFMPRRKLDHPEVAPV